ncbi:MAG TPA: hypothetical protein EYQ61_02020 [Dehalococcoidia bacterium]|nr:hypothetical protein [Dehalococcoidia bacterium]HIK90268.1 hypothetical protein [Dehalococcoidia bacterium]
MIANFPYIALSRTKLLALIAIAVLAIGVGATATTVSAQDTEVVKVISFSAESQFPEGMTFKLDIETDLRIDDVRVTFEIGQRGTTTYSYLELDQTTRPLVNGELFHRTNSRDRYIPPGTIIKYWFEITDENGDSHLTDPVNWRYDDARFEWEEVTLGAVTILYHGPVRVRAERLAEAAVESLDLMGRVTGSETETPIIMTLYNNNAEMIEAVVARSLATSRELITEGQAFDSESVVLVLAGRSDIGTATHEMTHILVARAAGSSGSVPLWLNEGLAEYGNLDKTVSYERFLEWAIGTDRLILLKSLRSFPGDPNLTLVAYGQGRSAVEFMIEEYGEAKMGELLSTLGTGIGISDALDVVYGFDIDEFENIWRDSIGADEYIPPTPGPSPTPAAEPTPAYKLLTLPPESSSSELAENVEPTELPEPTAAPVVPDAPEDEADDPVEAEASDNAVEESEHETSSGTCSAPSTGSVDGTAGAWLLAIVGLAAGNRYRTRKR